MESNMQERWKYIYIHKLLHWPYDLVSNNTSVVRCDDWVATHPLGCDHVSDNQHKTSN
jgi:hypothetical protein